MDCYDIAVTVFLGTSTVWFYAYVFALQRR